MASEGLIAPPPEMAPGIWRIFFDMPWHFLKSVNGYLVRDTDGFVLVDCGLDHDDLWASLLAQLEALKVPLSAIHTLVPTHAHPDHTGLANRLMAETDVAVLLHEHEIGFIDYRRNDAATPVVQAWLRRFGVPEEEVEPMLGQVRQGDRDTPGLAATRVLQGGEELRFGAYAFEVRWTPGHTPGHVCLYDPASQVLLCGDHILQDVAPNVGLLPYSDDNPMPGYLASMEWLRALDVKTVLPGHGDRMQDLAGRARQLIGHQLDRREQLLSLLGPQPQTAYQLAAIVWAETVPNTWADFNPRIRRNAIATLGAHLELLADEGRIARVVDDGTIAYIPSPAGRGSG
jgi:glyoxylase-like metal-dependent hydrolase (beta-lactamase superfamily II)